MIDTNVDLFQWPFRRLAGDDPASLVPTLRKKGVTQAWAGNYEGLLHRDVEGVNARLAAACKQYGPKFLIPFGTVNPKIPDWQEDLRRCHEVYRMPGIRLHPDYHGYQLDEPVAVELFSLVGRRKLLLQVAFGMEDPRTQFPLLRVAPVNLQPLPQLLKRTPELRVMILNFGHWGGPEAMPISDLGKIENVYFDIAMTEKVGGVKNLTVNTSPTRVVFGSHYPFLYFESAVLKIREAGLSHDETQAVLEGNARTFLGAQNS
jgi:predicted TIM-barrel fold metal-dependent hydrolase